jgi:hypothetical protein
MIDLKMFSIQLNVSGNVHCNENDATSLEEECVGDSFIDKVSFLIER